jgi:hypothetical protein
MRKYIFSDESGDLTFSRKPNVSRYFVVCTISLDKCDIGNALLELRRELVWQKLQLGDYFHASEDRQVVRDRVFEVIRASDLVVDATIMEKSKAQPQVFKDKYRFFQTGWFFHFKNIVPRLVTAKHEMMITVASVGTNRERAHFKSSINDVSYQVANGANTVVDFLPCGSDPCLQIADYCSWAIWRKWEHQDERSYRLISNKIVREYDLWRAGSVHHY